MSTCAVSRILNFSPRLSLHLKSLASAVRFTATRKSGRQLQYSKNICTIKAKLRNEWRKLQFVPTGDIPTLTLTAVESMALALKLTLRRDPLSAHNALREANVLYAANQYQRQTNSGSITIRIVWMAQTAFGKAC